MDGKGYPRGLAGDQICLDTPNHHDRRYLRRAHRRPAVSRCDAGHESSCDHGGDDRHPNRPGLLCSSSSSARTRRRDAGGLTSVPTLSLGFRREAAVGCDRDPCQPHAERRLIHLQGRSHVKARQNSEARPNPTTTPSSAANP
nr:MULTISPECIES: hypothetical protein [unclassified Bradyrhizobium]